jgi:hypothetical protein
VIFRIYSDLFPTERNGKEVLPCATVKADCLNSQSFYSSTDPQTISKIYIKIDIKTAPTCFGAASHTVIRERTAGAC